MNKTFPLFAQPLTSYLPKAFCWTGMTKVGNLIGGFADTAEACREDAKAHEPLAYFVSGKTPLDIFQLRFAGSDSKIGTATRYDSYGHHSPR